MASQTAQSPAASMITDDFVDKILTGIRQIPSSFWVTTITVFALFIAATISPDEFFQQLHAANGQLFEWFGGGYLWFVSLSLIAFVGLGVSPLGKIRLGGPDEKPRFSVISWLSMLFCCGMGTGIMFWGAAEPLYHFLNPPLANMAAKQQALHFSFFHWGFHPWGIYGLTTLAIAYFGYNLKRGFCFSSFIGPPPKAEEEENVAITHSNRDPHADDNKPSPWIAKLQWGMDFITLVAVVSGVAATFGMGVLHLEGGLEHLLGWHHPIAIKIGIIVFLLAAYMTSSLTGLDKGIKYISLFSIGISVTILLALMFNGPTLSMLSQMVSSIPSFLANLPQYSLGQANYEDPAWVGEWTIMYWSWWIAWAPFVGIFIAAISKGRTIRELALGVLLIPTLFSILWFSVFGLAAINAQEAGGFAGGELDLDHLNMVLFQLLEHFKLVTFLPWLCLLLIALNFINSADSATYTVSCLSLRNVEKAPPFHLQTGWGILIAALTTVFLFTGGIRALQQVTLVTTFPFTLMLIAIFIALFVVLFKRRKIDLAMTQSSKEQAQSQS